MNLNVYEANKKIEEDMYSIKLIEFNNCGNRTELMSKYKNHNMRLSLIIDKDIAIKKKNYEYADFIDSVIKEMTNEISLINQSVIQKNTSDLLKKFSFHEKVNIIFYVREDFYDQIIDTNEILTKDGFKLLSNSIIEEANSILKVLNINLKEIKNINKNALSELIKDKELYLDICFASELLNKGVDSHE